MLYLDGVVIAFSILMLVVIWLGEMRIAATKSSGYYLLLAG